MLLQIHVNLLNFPIHCFNLLSQLRSPKQTNHNNSNIRILLSIITAASKTSLAPGDNLSQQTIECTCTPKNHLFSLVHKLTTNVNLKTSQCKCRKINVKYNFGFFYLHKHWGYMYTVMYAVYPWILEFLSVASISKYLALPSHDNLHHREHTIKPGTPSPTPCELCGGSFFLSPTEYTEHI